MLLRLGVLLAIQREDSTVASEVPAIMTSTHPSRVILFHKQSTSARTRFLLFAHGGVCGPEPLPELAEMMGEPPVSGAPAPHPAALIRQTAERLGLGPKGLEAVGEFRHWVDVAGGPVVVFLAAFTSIDPPFGQVAEHGARFIDLTEARALPPAELELLRKAYELLLGG